jgi:hypothetical protein
LRNVALEEEEGDHQELRDAGGGEGGGVVMAVVARAMVMPA